ncbi:hypothetical protein JKF63_02085 [Porcisia hertigi]|uniref:Uncharacterized protein n=1 Tax=Porcisia hertigi TaxID=2761500 RepID=A0A836I7J8_9TRYP|nr:hypothetical protein JKF63_02085 [Porcisia hertigi]
MSLFLGLPAGSWAVLGIEFVERLGFYAVSFSLFTYCTVMLQTGPAWANALVNIVYILIPSAAFAASGWADSRTGRPCVLAVALAVYAASLLLLCLSATPWFYTSFPHGVTWGSRVLFAFSLVGFSIGYGSMKVCTNPIMADCVVLHYHSAFMTAPIILDDEQAETEEGAASLAKTFVPSTREMASLADVAGKSVTADATGTLSPVSKGDPLSYGTAVSLEDATTLSQEEQVKAALSRLFVYAYWIANCGGLVGIFVAPLLRNIESRRLVQGSKEYTTGYYYTFLLASTSVSLGGIVLYRNFARLPRNAATPTFVFVRVLVLALRNRWAVLRGNAKVVSDGSDDLSAPRDWLDYAWMRLQPVLPEAEGAAFATHHSIGNNDTAASEVPISAASSPISGTPLGELDGGTDSISLWVAECRTSLNICKDFIALPIYWLICNQFSTNIMYLAAALDLPPLVPGEIFNNINTLTTLLLLVLWDRWLLPRVLQNRVPSACLRIVAGFVCMCTTMMWCGCLQCFINIRGYYKDEDTYVLHVGQQKLSVGWLVIPYVLQGFASAFVDPTVMEVAYRDAPERMKGTVMGLYWLASSASGFLGLILSPVMKPQNAAALFFCFAAAQMVVSVVFYLVNRDR